MLDDLRASFVHTLDTSPTADGRPFRAYDARHPVGASASEAASTPCPRRPKPRRRFPAEVLSDDEVRALMDACSPHPPPIYRLTDLRNRALIAFLYRTGCRIREALEVRPKDLDLNNGSVRLLVCKGGRSRTVGIDAGGAAEVHAWLDAHAAFINYSVNARSAASPRFVAPVPRSPSALRTVEAAQLGAGRSAIAPLFCTAGGGRLTEAYVRRLLPRLAQQAGIDRRVHAHGLRHTHAAQLRSEGVDIGIISKQLGHRSIATTARYLDHIAPLAVVQAIAKRAW